jgi:hypothetical protein
MYDDFIFEYYFLDFKLDPDYSKISLLKNHVGDDLENKLNLLDLSSNYAYKMKDYEKINALSIELQKVYENIITKSADIDFKINSIQKKHQENLKQYQLAKNKNQYNYTIMGFGLLIILTLIFFKYLYKNKVIENKKNNEIINKYTNIAIYNNEFDNENYLNSVLIPLTYELAKIEDDDQFEKLSLIYYQLREEYEFLVNFNKKTKELFKDVSRNNL